MRGIQSVANMTLDFEDWTDGELLSLFCAGITTELIQEHKLSTTAMLAFPVLSVDGFTMYEELLATGYYPEKREWKKYIQWLNKIKESEIE